MTSAAVAGDGSDGIEAFNSLPADRVEALLAQCADIPRWIAAVAAGRPFADRVALVARAGDGALSWLPGEVDVAIAHHPRIGGRIPEADILSVGEQSAVLTDGDAPRLALVEANVAYERRFGRVFLIRASGRGGPEILAEALRRTKNDPVAEAREVSRELREIALLRLDLLVRSLTEVDDLG